MNALELWLSALQEIPRLLAAADTIDKAGKEILQLICKAMDCACGIRWELTAGSFRRADTWSDGKPATERFLAASTRSPVSKAEPGDMLGTVRVTGGPVVASDLGEKKESVCARPTGCAGLRSAFAFPMRSDVGVTVFRPPGERR